MALSRRSFLEALGTLPGAVLYEPQASSSPPPTGDKTVSDLKLTALAAGAVLNRHIRTGYMSGAVAMITRGDRAEVIEMGQQAIEQSGAMRRDCIFRIASMTKPVTAAAAMMLVERQVLRLNDPISKWLPELAHRRVLKRLDGPLNDTVPEKRPITVEDLLTLRCGLGALMTPPGTYPIQREIAELGLLGFGPPDPSNPLDPDEWLRRLAKLPLMAQPGEEWLYNTGSYILGVLLARATRRSLPDLLRVLVFEPLGMRDTGFFVPESARDRLVSAYRLEAGRLTLYDAPAISAWGSPPRFPDAGGGLVSSIDDYMAFVLALLAAGRTKGPGLLKDVSVAAMTTDHLTATQRDRGVAILGSGRGWGYGLAVVDGPTEPRLPLGSIGWTGGLGTSWQSDPASGLTALLLTQTMFTSPVAPMVHQEFQRAVFAPTFT